MFFILACSRDGGETWEDEYQHKWDKGAEAQEEAKFLNAQNKRYAELGSGYAKLYGNIRYRVRQILDTDTDNFYAREAAKNYKPLEYEFKYNGPESYALVHIHPDNPRQVRFFDSLKDAIRCQYTVMNIPRFLVSYMDQPTDQVEEFLSNSGYYNGTYEFDITQDADLIEWAYTEGPTSCMNDPDEYPLPSPHPSRVYAGGDLAVAYINRDDNCTARAVVYPEKKIYAKIYGHDKLLSSELEKLGYRRTHAMSPWRGARILKIYLEEYEAYLMPYVDMAETLTASRCGKFFRLAARSGTWTCRDTCGWVEGQDWSY